MGIIKRWAAAAAMVALAAGVANAEIKKIVIGTEGAYPPFNNLTADGKLVGFDVEIAEALCAEMKVECEFVTQDWDGIIPALIAGKFDAIIASMSITDERKQVVDFTEKYYNTPPAIAVPKDSKLAGVTAADLAGVRMGAQGSTTHSNYAEEKFPDGACCKILGTLTPDLVINGEGAGIAIRKGEDELKGMFNTAIQAIRANGKYQEINDKYFKFDVYGS